MSLQSDRRQLLQLSMLAAAASILPLAAAKADDVMPADPNDLAHAFDLFVGTWNVKHRQLKERLAGSHDWIEFGGTQVLVPILGGMGNADENFIDKPGDPYLGFTVRAYDSKTKMWAIWWLDGRSPDAISVPTVGTFKDGVGTFYDDEDFNGKPIKVRFLWSEITSASRKWEQAFSADGGKTWETNWIAWFTKTA
jgi:hypothetical protein